MIASTTLGELLRKRAENTAEDQGYRYLGQGTAVTESLSYKELDHDARGIAAKLQNGGVKPGSRVLLLYPPGLDFVRAFFGCMQAGAVAVPAYPPNPARIARTLPRLRALARDCSATVVLTCSKISAAADALLPLAPEFGSWSWIVTDDGPLVASGWRAPAAGADDLALLQYTSGSTREPRGVMISHGNILHNQRLINAAFGHREREVIVTWLPVYHDMGLIGMLIQPLYLGAPCVMMPPLEFLGSPVKWLSAISTHRGTTSGAPNFAYDHATRKVSDAALDELDLSSWRVAFCGAEPVRKATLDRFAQRFRRCGFSARAFLPCYGLAETTLIVSGASRETGAFVLSVDDDELREGRAVPSSAERARFIVGCGPVVGDQEVAIVAEGARCATRHVGEIWVRGPSVGAGYFGRPDESKDTFGAFCTDGTGPFLRTGDLGFLDEGGELYILGRAKDLIIVRGLNHQPSDIEATVERAWPGLRPGCTVVFALDGNESEEVVVLSEYDQRGARAGVDWEIVVGAIRSAVAEAHDLALRAVVLLSAGQVPKTTSGKVQRSAAKGAYLAGNLGSTAAPTHPTPDGLCLEVLHRWVAGDGVLEAPEPGSLRTPGEIAAFIVTWLSEMLKRPIDPAANFASIGLDSFEVVTVMDALGRRLGRELGPMLAIDYPSTNELAAYLASTAPDAIGRSTS